ncbi:hypothetical protein Bpfe_031324 [Biomphalaria pfeifferi]|uniref:Uncharacterized protein n=1 Tax=Biomphalaria pfeifferi TaxID=112525 RepID=A0AAD8AN34_BIOPF|nr:hypothetical protein Bpfe_031324 [Biomphalaria pfeifferi]
MIEFRSSRLRRCGFATDDRIVRPHAVQDTAFADHRIIDVAVMNLRRRQIARARIDRHYRIEEIKFRKRRGKVEIGFKKCADRADVLPVIVEKMRLNV